jgi:hypothetical protein
MQKGHVREKQQFRIPTSHTLPLHNLRSCLNEENNPALVVVGFQEGT